MDDDIAANLERERLERLAKEDEHRREDDPYWQRNYARGALGIHEALHTTHVFGDMIDRHLAEHPVVLLHPHLYALASKAGMALAELYQAVGNLPTDEGRHD